MHKGGMAQIPEHISRHVPPRHGGRRALATKGGECLLDFSANAAPVGVSPAVLDALRGEIESQVSEYPDPRSGMLLAELSKYTGMPEPNIIAGNGATEIIYNAALVLGGCGGGGGGGADERSHTLVQAPTFSEYAAASSIYHHNSHIVHFESMDMSADLDGFIKRVPDVGMVFVCNPNNPTGRLLSRGEVLEVADAAAAARSCHMVVDECFVELSSRPEESVMPHVRRYDNLVVLRSLTKSFGLPGIRAGYAVAHPRIIDALYRVKVPWSTSGMAEVAGAAALRDAERILREARGIIRRETPYVIERFSGSSGVSCYDTDANFILVRTELDSAALQKELAGTHGILVRDCSDFRGLGGRGHIRVAVRGRRDNAAMADALLEAARGR